jgi:hypothetical protein
MNIKYDSYTNKYFIFHSESNVVSMTFEELEEFGEAIKEVCQDVYSQALQFEMDLGGDDCESGACKI